MIAICLILVGPFRNQIKEVRIFPDSRIWQWYYFVVVYQSSASKQYWQYHYQLRHWNNTPDNTSKVNSPDSRDKIHYISPPWEIVLPSTTHSVSCLIPCVASKSSLTPKEIVSHNHTNGCRQNLTISKSMTRRISVSLSRSSKQVWPPSQLLRQISKWLPVTEIHSSMNLMLSFPRCHLYIN